MGTEESESVEIRTRLQSDVQWTRGIVAGFAASLVMAVVVGLWDPSLLRETIAGLYGQGGNLVVGVLTHVVHGTVFGALFAFVLSDPGVYHLEDDPWKSVLAGVVFGLVLALAGAGLIMPVWLNALQGGRVLPIPNVTLPLVAWHLVYGFVLGGVYAMPVDRGRTD